MSLWIMGIVYVTFINLAVRFDPNCPWLFSAIAVLGFLPQELLNTSMYAYCHRDDISTLTESLKLILRTGQKLTTSIYRFRTKEKGFLLLQSEWKLLLNPWTKELQYIYAKNLVIL